MVRVTLDPEERIIAAALDQAELDYATERGAAMKKPRRPISEHDAAVAAFIRHSGITRCPTVCLVRTQASVSAADQAALQQHEAKRAAIRANRRWPAFLG